MNVIKTEPNLGSNIKKDLKKSFKINEKSEDKINQTNNISTFKIYKTIKVPRYKYEFDTNNKNINNAFFETTEVTDESKKKSRTAEKSKKKTMEDESIIKDRIKEKYLIKEKEKEVELIDLEIKIREKIIFLMLKILIRLIKKKII